ALRPRRAGVAGAVVYVAGGFGWLLFGRPPAAGSFVAWFLAAGLVQTFVPGLANQVTIARAYLAVPALAYAIRPGGFGSLAATVAIAGATDLLDGTIARRFDRPTQFGGALDPVVDGLF